jgi:hypothetical protein
MRPAEIERLMKHRGQSPERAFINIASSLMANFNMSFDEVKKLPIPTAMEFLRILKEEDKKFEDQMKKANKHGRHHH